MTISGLRSHSTALITAMPACVGLLSLSSAPAWAAAGTITEFPVPAGTPFGITAGPDGNLWFGDGAGVIGRIMPSGTITLFPVPSSGYTTAGPDGNLWFTDGADSASAIGRITTGGSFTEFPIPTAGSTLQGITAGPDGNLWFTEDVLSSKGPKNKIDGKIGRITTGGSFTEFPLPGNCGKYGTCAPHGITTGPDGNLWFTEENGNVIGRITPSGSFSGFRTPTAGSRPEGITTGPDGNLWFTEENASKIGRITTS